MRVMAGKREAMGQWASGVRRERDKRDTGVFRDNRDFRDQRDKETAGAGKEYGPGCHEMCWSPLGWFGSLESPQASARFPVFRGRIAENCNSRKASCSTSSQNSLTVCVFCMPLLTHGLPRGPNFRRGPRVSKGTNASKNSEDRSIRRLRRLRRRGCRTRIRDRWRNRNRGRGRRGATRRWGMAWARSVHRVCGIPR